MFIWTVQDAIGFGLLAILLLLFIGLWIASKFENLWKRLRPRKR